MTTYCLTKSALIAEITAAFDGVTRDDGVTLHQASVLDSYGGPEDQAAARAQDTEARWQDVPHEDIRTTYSVLNSLDSKGFHYYIPAYIVWYLTYIDDDETEDWTENFTSIPYQLTGGYQSGLSDHQIARFALFTPEQSRAVAHFLLYLAANDEFFRLTSMDSEAMPDTDPTTWEKAWQLAVEQPHPDNAEKRAIDQYWGQFL